jgi:uncharacterized repeat protein (TIGR03803 family)
MSFAQVRFTVRSAARFLALTALLALLVPSLIAQNVLKKLAVNTDPDTWSGGIQASDGNFYTTSIISGIIPLAFDCQDGTDNSCTYITKITPDGVITVLHTFEIGGDTVNTEGFGATSLLEASDGNFYGVCLNGGQYGNGTIFKLTKAGTYTLLYTFPTDYAHGNDVVSGVIPNSLIQGADGALYGTALSGGPNINGHYSVGTLFRITLDGTFRVIHTFPSSPAGATLGNPEGADPISLVQGTDGNFYGTTVYSAFTGGGTTATGNGTIFSVTPDGTLTTLHNFAADGSEGINPYGPLTAGPDGSFYGTTAAYGIVGSPAFNDKTFYGNFYKISSTGNFQVLYTFTGGTDGASPGPDLTLGSDGKFYGSTRYAGNTTGCSQTSGCGVIYQMLPSGTENVVHSFLGGTDGGVPFGPMVQLNDGSFFGTVVGDYAGGGMSPGGAYNLALSPALKGPIQITFDPKTVAVNQPVKLTWNVLNAYSATMQQCHASISGTPTGAGTWSGPQLGSASDGGFGSNTTITPTVEGTYTYLLNCGGRETGSATLVVGNLLTVATTSLPAATVATPYSQNLVATGGTPPYTWTITSGTTPSGLSFDPTAGLLSGTPDQFGEITLGVQVKDSASAPDTAYGTVTLSIKSGLQIVTTTLPKAVIGVKYAQALAATGGKTPYTWSLLSGTLPDGITFSPSTGVFSGTPTKAVSASFLVQVKDAESTAATYSAPVGLPVTPPQLAILTTSLPPGLVGTNYSQVFNLTGGTAPFQWSLTSGTLPRGLAFAAGAGVISGTPVQFGSGTVTVKVTDSSTPQMTDSVSVNLAINSGLNITTTAFTSGMVGAMYSSALTATGGVSPYKWTLDSGTLPAGLTLSADSGVLSGTPTTLGNFSFTIRITDSEGTPASTSAPFSVNISTAVGASVTFTAKVVGTTSTPNGIVTFYNGTTSLGTGTLNTSGVATLTTSFGSPGSYPITAVYGGNTALTGSTSAILTETVVAVSVSAAFSPSSLTIASGSSGTLTITLTPTGGYTGTVSFSCGTLPARVSCTFAPPSLAITASTTTATETLTINTAANASTTAMLRQPERGDGRRSLSSFTTMALLFPGSLLALLGISRRRGSLLPRVWMLGLLLLIAAGATTLSGCGSSGIAAAPGNYAIPVNLTLAGGTSQTINATVIVK